MMKVRVSEWWRPVFAAAVLSASIAGVAQAAVMLPQFEPQYLGSTQAGGSFTLWWIDPSLPMSGPTSFTDGDVWVAYDATVLNLTGLSAGSIFNGAVAQEAPAAGQAQQYSWIANQNLTLRPFMISGGAQPGVATQQDVVTARFDVLLSAPTGRTYVYFLPDQSIVQMVDLNLAVPGYYAFRAAEGYSTYFDITPVPEPASVALMLAGLGVVAAAAARRKPAPAA